MKNLNRKIKYVLLLLISILLVSCSENKRNKIYIDYITNTIPRLEEIDKKIIESFRSVTGENYKTDYELVKELNEKTIPLTKKLVRYSNEIYNGLENKDLKEIQDHYTTWANTYLDYFESLSDALLSEENIEEKLQLAEETGQRANELLDEFEVKVEFLRTKAKITAKKE